MPYAAGPAPWATSGRCPASSAAYGIVVAGAGHRGRSRGMAGPAGQRAAVGAT